MNFNIVIYNKLAEFTHRCERKFERIFVDTSQPCWAPVDTRHQWHKWTQSTLGGRNQWALHTDSHRQSVGIRGHWHQLALGTSGTHGVPGAVTGSRHQQWALDTSKYHQAPVDGRLQRTALEPPGTTKQWTGSTSKH